MSATILEKIILEIQSNNPGSKTLRKIIDPDLTFQAAPQYGQSLEMLTELVINHIFNGKYEEAKNLIEDNSSFSETLNQLPQVSFDIAQLMDEPEKQIGIVENFKLDPKRTTEGYISFATVLLSENKLSKLKALHEIYERRLNNVLVQPFAVNEFQKAMYFGKNVQNRDYRKALFIIDLYSLPQEKTYTIAFEEFLYQKKERNYLEAAYFAKNFRLPVQTVLIAAFQAFEKYLEKFMNKFRQEEYTDKELSPSDPYNRALQITRDFELLKKQPENPENPDIQSSNRSKIQNVVFTNFKIITNRSEFTKVPLKIKTFFASRLLIDYELDSLKTNKITLNLIEDAVRWIILQIDDDVNTVADADNYYDVLLNMAKISFFHRNTIQRVANRVFELYLKEDLLKKAQKAMADFGLSVSDIMPSLLELCKKFLHNGEYSHFNEIVDLFDLTKAIRAKPDFIEDAYSVYYNAVSRGNLKNVEIIQDICDFNRKRRLKPFKILVKQKILYGFENEANQLFHKYDFSLSDVSDEIAEIYHEYAQTDIVKARDFRKKYSLSIFDIGIIQWFFHEFLPLLFSVKPKIQE